MEEGKKGTRVRSDRTESELRRTCLIGSLKAPIVWVNEVWWRSGNDWFVLSSVLKPELSFLWEGWGGADVGCRSVLHPSPDNTWWYSNPIRGKEAQNWCDGGHQRWTLWDRGLKTSKRNKQSVLEHELHKSHISPNIKAIFWQILADISHSEWTGPQHRYRY